MFIRNLKKDIQTLLPITGIYIFYKKNKPVYIGKSVNIKARLLSHLENSRFDNKERAITDTSDKIEIISTENEFKALLLESKLINQNQPRYNKSWKDDKSYLYIKITVKDKYPKIFLVRKENDHRSVYFGPFSGRNIAEELLREIRRVIPFCTQKKLTKKACFYHKINLCDPCPNSIEATTDKEEKKLLTAQYRKNIRNILAIFKGRSEIVINDLKKQIKLSSASEDYESAIKLRNRLFYLERVISQRIGIDNNQDAVPYVDRIRDLLDILNHYYPDLNSLERIEAYDISNLNFKEATGSMVVFRNGVSDKSQYRKFKIKNNRLDSDFFMINEVISRRFKNNWPKPNLIVIDGGKPQIRILLAEMNKIQKENNIPIIGIAKNPDRLVIGIRDLPTVKLRLDRPGLNLIREMRDEAHRFAKKYHLVLREKKLLL